MGDTEQLAGTVERILYRNEQNGYVVFSLKLKNRKLETVTGNLLAVHPGEQVVLSGAWTVHAKFGKQFVAQSCIAHSPTSVVGLKKYLSSGLIKGIGPTYAEKLVDRFGVDVLDIIDEQPLRLAEVEGIGPKRVEKIIAAWQEQRSIAHIMVFLQEKGISPVYAAKIYKRYGNDAVSVITENPYRLADDIWGIGFKLADQIAKNMGFEHNSPKRITAGVLFSLAQIIGNGHLYASLDTLRNTVVELLDLDKAATANIVKMSLHELYESQKIRLVSVDSDHYVAPSRCYAAEKGASNRLKQLRAYPTRHSFDIGAIHRSLMVPAEGSSVALSEDQQRGILACLQNKVAVVTGGPGTGKTTLIKELLRVLKKHNLRYRLAAPTGRAAKRMYESTGSNAETIHRLLEFDVSTMRFTRNEDNALSVDFLIVDEASMIDIALAHAVLRALPLSAHLLFIGDVDQLPSVGPGNFLLDLIASKAVPSVRLMQIFRQARESLIVVNAHRINRGEYPASRLPEANRDYLMIKEEQPELLPRHLQAIFAGGLKKYGIATNDAIVLTPMNRGAAGTQRLNGELQQILNPPADKQQLSYLGTIYAEGDRVMQLRNNYDKIVFNGDIGTIDAIDLDDQTICVRYGERPVTYERSELDELMLAYAVTIHKSQGSEYPAVIVPLFTQHFMLLQRNLLYTAITRAKKLCIFIGQPKAIAIAIRNDKGLARTTFLRQYLTSDLSCR